MCQSESASGLKAMLLLTFLLFTPLRAVAMTSATTPVSLQITATVKTECSITLSSDTLDLGTVSATDVRAHRGPGQPLTGLSRSSFDVITRCTGRTTTTPGDVLTLSTPIVAGGDRVGTDGDFIRYSVSSLVFNSVTKSVSFPIGTGDDLGTGHLNHLPILVVTGANYASAIAGTYSATLTITLTTD